MTNKDITSSVLGAVRALSPENRIPRRQALALLRIVSKYFIDQKVKDGTISLDKIFKPMECIPLEKIDSISCPLIEFRSYSTLMRTKTRLPEPLRNKYGAMIRNVMNIDYTISFTKTTRNKHLNNKKKNKYPMSNDNYYFEIDGYLYIPDQDIQMVNIEIATLHTEDIETKSECGDSCVSVWDMEFVVPDNLENVVVEYTRDVLMGTRQIPGNE